MGSVIIGSGRALPARIVTNDELSEIVDTTDEWIVPRTGIHTRHVAIEETCTDLGAQAALRALGLEEGGWQREAGAIDAATLGMIICPTLTADTHFPSEAARIRAEERLQHKQSMHEYYQSKIALNRAMQRLQATAKYNR